jgi:hypothetical protein
MITVLREPPGSNLLESRMMRKYQVRFGGGRQKRGRKATALTAHPTWPERPRKGPFARLGPNELDPLPTE